MLFILKSNNKDYCRKILGYMEEGDKIIFIQDATLMLHNQENEYIRLFKEKKAEILFLENDLKARGIEDKFKAKGISFEKMIELIENNKIFS